MDLHRQFCYGLSMYEQTIKEAAVDYSVLNNYDYDVYTPFFNLEFYRVRR